MSLLNVENLRVYYETDRGYVKAVDNVSFEVREGEVFGIAGESGCGKSTLVQSLVLLKPPLKHISGDALLNGLSLFKSDIKTLEKIRMKEISIIPQYALNALNPTRKVRDIVVDIIRSKGYPLSEREVEELLEQRLSMVMLSKRVKDMYPIELSGGMRQRVSLVISTLLNPKLLIADEITSALDVSTQRRILELLQDFMKTGIVKSLIFVTHDLASLYQIADRIMIMYAGKVVELGPIDEIINNPAHPYTRALISSVPKLGASYKTGRLSGLKGHPPSLLNPPTGCRFHPRCPYAARRCVNEEPPMVKVGEEHYVSCWLYAGGV
ncbi:ABC transporter ATP-binding protein [Infirmifilum sp. NZ]|uniref:ABC transporter ATP-binding protein n=1 Tax=Infirmifilum sp. NZ TaxID=2926850 RepID=UPI0027A7E0AE|nr:ABC transporter ATP-binding protein [Infirmifilum sp. NZ]UNQ73332.1 ABC transporter ATP-binding protein [Infirmifilum sp. NZ]